MQQKIEEILRQSAGERPVLRSQNISYGQFIETGPQRGGVIQSIGYCVQIRKGVGVYGTDIVFLRHADGRLVTHENQFFFALGDEQVEQAKVLFDCLPADEEAPLGYGDCNGVREVGFIIENSSSKPGFPGESVHIRVEGEGKSTLTAFI